MNDLSTAEYVLSLVISFIITWAWGLSIPLLIRYAIFKRPFEKTTSIIIVAILWIINIFIFTALGSESKTHAVQLLVAIVSYYILRRGSKVSGLDDPTAIPVKKYAKKYGVKELKVIELIEAGKLNGKKYNSEWFVLPGIVANHQTSQDQNYETDQRSKVERKVICKKCGYDDFEKQGIWLKCKNCGNQIYV
jgi:hypothetical protein